MLGLQTKDFIEVNVVKFIDDLKSPDDLLMDPRSLSPDELKEACNNTRLEFTQDLEPALELTLNFLLKNFFYTMHQTGLYNPQKRLWSSIAQTKKIKIKKFKKLSKKEKETASVYDAILEDSFGKFILARIVMPSTTMELPGLNDLLSNINSRCIGLFYVSNQPYTEKSMAKVREKTNYQDFFDKYRSPIGENASLDLIQYTGDESKMNFKLVHPNLGKEVESTLCFVAS